MDAAIDHHIIALFRLSVNALDHVDAYRRDVDKLLPVVLMVPLSVVPRVMVLAHLAGYLADFFDKYGKPFKRGM